jgi:putative ABC transport system permease protein
MMRRVLLQLWAVTTISVTSMPQRAGAAAVAIMGIGGVAMVLVSVLSIVHGFQSTLARAGDPNRAIVLRSGSQDEISSALPRDAVRIIQEAPGVERGASGALAAAELVEMVTLPRASTSTAANVTIRGLEPGGFGMRGDVRIVEGRQFVPGRREIIVGRAAQGQFAGLDVGRTVAWDTDAWLVTGVFDTGGTIAESEIWCDVSVLQSAFRKEGMVSAARVRLISPDAFVVFRDWVVRNPRLNVAILRESDYYVQQSTATTQLISTVGVGIVGLMALGAVFCALNTMYSAVSARVREMATLRALGFGGGAVALAVLFESALLALIGGSIGALTAWGLFDGYQTSTLNWQSFSQVVFAFSVTPRLVGAGLLSSISIGVLGGILPAIRAARLPIAPGLREL